MNRGNWGRGMHHDRWDWHWIPMLVVVVVVLVLLVWLASTTLRRSAEVPMGPQGAPVQHPGPRLTAEEILAERLAHGDIEVDDYHRRLEALHKPRPNPS